MDFPHYNGTLPWSSSPRNELENYRQSYPKLYQYARNYRKTDEKGKARILENLPKTPFISLAKYKNLFAVIGRKRPMRSGTES